MKVTKVQVSEVEIDLRIDINGNIISLDKNDMNDAELRMLILVSLIGEVKQGDLFKIVGLNPRQCSRILENLVGKGLVSKRKIQGNANLISPC